MVVQAFQHPAFTYKLQQSCQNSQVGCESHGLLKIQQALSLGHVNMCSLIMSFITSAIFSSLILFLHEFCLAQLN